MKKIAFLLAVSGAIFLSVFYTAPAHAQATRTWVSGVGDDVNPCSRTSPCKTFAGAISKTVAGGEINCLDPGGFGALTITKSIIIDCHETFGSVLVSGSNGSTIDVPSGFVTLRNINFNGLLNDTSGAPGLIGISITAAQTVFIEDCLVQGFSNHGISDTRSIGGNLFVRNTVVRNNISGGSNAAGFNLGAASPNNVVLENVHAVANNFGVLVGNKNNVVVSRSVVAGNNIAGVMSSGEVLVDFTEVIANGQGLNDSSVAGGVFQIANSDVYFNAVAIAGTANIGSFGNNRIQQNNSAGSAVGHGVASQEFSQE
jgi:hypothetical protein